MLQGREKGKKGQNMFFFKGFYTLFEESHQKQKPNIKEVVDIVRHPTHLSFVLQETLWKQELIVQQSSGIIIYSSNENYCDPTGLLHVAHCESS